MTEQQIKDISSAVASNGKQIAVLKDGSPLMMPAITLGTMHRINAILSDVKMEINDDRVNIHNLLSNNLEVVGKVIAELVFNAPNCPPDYHLSLMEQLTMDELETATIAVVEALDIPRFFLITTSLNQIRIKVRHTQDQIVRGLSSEASAST